MAAQLLTRAQALVAAGPFSARAAEIAAVHAVLYPNRDAVCQTCRGELGRAYYAIQRWTEQQGAASEAPNSSNPMKKNSVARFTSDSTIYTPHGLGVAYSNANLTDKAARDILAADPDAAALFDVLPPAAHEGASSDNSDAQSDTTTTTASESATLPAGFDYAKLASALADELARRQAVPALAVQPQPAPTLTAPAQPEQPAPAAPALTASTGGASDASVASPGEASQSADDESADDQKPVRLSRMTKDQLVAAHLDEVGTPAPADATNDELRQAIATARAGQATA